MRILLLEPLNSAEIIWGSFAREKGYIPPIGILYIYTFLKKRGYDVQFYDTQFAETNNEEVLKKYLQQNKFSLIGIPVFTNTAVFSFYTARFCKKILPASKIVFGGIHASVVHKRTMKECPDVDYIIRGEGEEAMVDLIEYLLSDSSMPPISIAGLVWRREDDTVQCNSDRSVIRDLGVLPENIYEDIDVAKYVPHPGKYKRLPSVPLVAQRGCPFQCVFCGAQVIHGRKSRFVPVESMINQIRYLVEERGVKEITFQDSTFSLSKKYTVELLKRMISEKIEVLWSCTTRVDSVDTDMLKLMKESGCWLILFGVESGNQESLDLLKKGPKMTLDLIRKRIKEAKKTGINLINTFILGLPNEDERMVENTIAFAKELCSQIAEFYLPVPYPGTELYSICQKTGGLRTDAAWEDYLAVDFDNPVYVNPKLGKEKMKYYYRKAWRDYYNSPRVWLENLRQIKSIEDLRRYYRGYNALRGARFIF